MAILTLKVLDIGQESRQEMMIIMGTTTSFALNPKKKYLGQANLAQALNSVRAFSHGISLGNNTMFLIAGIDTNLTNELSCGKLVSYYLALLYLSLKNLYDLLGRFAGPFTLRLQRVGTAYWRANTDHSSRQAPRSLCYRDQRNDCRYRA